MSRSGDQTSLFSREAELQKVENLLPALVFDTCLSHDDQVTLHPI
jgi:hypothetical protein